MSAFGSPFQSTVQGHLEDSPNKQRIKLLSEKWQNIEHDIDREKQERRDILEDKLRNIEDKINSERPNDEQRFKILKEQVLKLQNTLEEEKNQREDFDQKKGKEIKILDENLHSLLEEEKSGKRMVENNLLKQINEKFYNMNLNMSKNNKTYEESTEIKLREVQTQIGIIKEQIDLEKKKEESTNTLTEEIENELNNFHDFLLIEKKVREQTQGKIYRMIEDIHQKLQSDLFQEKRERETTTESLIKLLDDTCLRVEKNFHQ